MKRMLVVLSILMILVGCQSKSDVQTLFVEKDKKYALRDSEGNLKTKFIYTKYEPVGLEGYVVKDKKGYHYLAHDGSELVKAKKNVKLSVLENIVVGQNKQQYTLYDSEGKVISKTNKKTKIIIDELPIIYKNKQYQVLDQYGNEIEKAKNKVVKVSVYHHRHVLICYPKKLTLYDGLAIEKNNDEKGQFLTVKLSGTYSLLDYSKKNGYLLYDANQKQLVRVNHKGKVVFKQECDITEAQFKNNAIVATKDNNTYILSLDGKTYQKVDGYYYDATHYVVKNKQYIYGPHQFVSGKKALDVDGIQINPMTNYVQYQIFNVYKRDQGYQFYKFNGQLAFKGSFKEATDFDNAKRAVVSKKEDQYYLIDLQGQKVSKNYQRIEYIGHGYYAGYKTNSKYEVIDKNGKKVIKDYFMGSKQIISDNDELLGVFNKSGTTYVYDLKENEVLFSKEGELTYKDGYFIKENHKGYYDIEGNVIYKR